MGHHLIDQYGEEGVRLLFKKGLHLYQPLLMKKALLLCPSLISSLDEEVLQALDRFLVPFLKARLEYYKYAPLTLRRSKAFLLSLVAKANAEQCFELYAFTASALREDREVFHAVMTKNPLCFRLAALELRDSLELLRPLLQSNPELIEFAGLSVCSDFEVMRSCIRQNPRLLSFASPSLQASFNLVQEAVQRDGTSLQYASQRLKSDPQIVALALAQHPQALAYVATSLIDEALILKVLSHQSLIACFEHKKQDKGNQGHQKLTHVLSQTGAQGHLEQAKNQLIQSTVEARLMLMQNGLNLANCSHGLRRNMSLATIAIQQNPFAIQFVKNPTPESIDLALSLEPATISVLPRYAQTKERWCWALLKKPALILVLS